MILFRMTQEEYDKLNPPPDILFTGAEGWHYFGHIPAPKTRLGWFIQDIIHGLLMRYRLLPVLVYALEGLFGKRQNSATEIVMDTEGNDSRCATLLEDDTDRIVGFMVEKYKENSPAQR